MEKTSLSEVKEKVLRFIEFMDPEHVDQYTERSLISEAIKYYNVSQPYLGSLEIKVNGYDYSSLLDAMYEEDDLIELSLAFTGLTLDPVWTYDVPTRRIKVNEKGKGGVLAYPSDPTKINGQWTPFTEPIRKVAMFRMMFSHYYIPRSAEEAGGVMTIEASLEPPLLDSPRTLWAEVRSGAVVPFEIRLMAYSQERRYAYRIDLLRNGLVKDFRDGRMPIHQWVQREPLDSLYVDKILSTNRLPELQKNIFETVFEGKDIASADIAHGFSITEAMARNHLGGLVKKELVVMDGQPPNETYRANIEYIKETKGDI